MNFLVGLTRIVLTDQIRTEGPGSVEFGPFCSKRSGDHQRMTHAEHEDSDSLVERLNRPIVDGYQEAG